jgi:hypothetical protein
MDNHKLQEPNANDLIGSSREDVAQAGGSSGKVSLDKSRQLLRFYESGLEGYTYLEEP